MRFILMFVGVALTGLGGLAAVLFAGLPALQVRAAKTWSEATCTVLSSEVHTEHRVVRGRTRSTYKPVITYSYDFDGRSYVGDRHDLVVGSVGDGAAVEEIVARHPPGASVRCFVDPTYPSRSVINRDAPPSMIVGLAMLPMVFAGVGLVAASAWLSLRKKKPRP